MIDVCNVDGYLITDGKLKKVTWINDELFIVDNGLMLYREHLDGPMICEEEARELYPEEFV